MCVNKYHIQTARFLGESVDIQTNRAKWPPHTLSVLSAQVVLSQLKIPNLNCWGPEESVDTHILGVWNIKDKVTSAYPRWPQCPGGPESAQNAKFWLQSSRGVHRHPYCRSFEQKGQSDLHIPSVSSVTLGSWVSSKCPIFIPGVQRNPTVPIL